MRRRGGSWVLLTLLLTTALAQAKRAPDLCTAVASGKLGPVQRALRAREGQAQVRCGGVPVLHHGILKGAPFDVLLALLHAGSDVNQRDRAGDTPLLLAVRLRDVELVKLLFQFGGDPARTNAVGLSAIDEAQQIGRSALLQAMGVPVPELPRAETATSSAAEDAGQAREDATARPEDAAPSPPAPVDAASLDAAIAPALFGSVLAAPGSAAAEPVRPTPVVVVQEEEVLPAPEPAAPGAGRKLLLFVLIAGGIVLAMRLALRLAR